MTKHISQVNLMNLAPTSLVGQLVAGGIIPLDEKEVREYMQLKRESIPHTFGAEILEKLVDGFNKRVFAICEKAMFLTAVLVVCTVCFSLVLQNLTLSLWLLAATVTMAILTMTINLLSYARVDLGIKGSAHWVAKFFMYPAHECLREVSAVAQRAKQILQQRYGEQCSLVIHELVQNNIVLDPVLEIHWRGESAFLAIWEEDVIIAIAG